MFHKVQKMLEEFHMVSAGDTVLVGLSGGADSVALFLVLSELAKTMDFSLEAVHVEHGIRGEESRRDAEFVEELCKKFYVPCQIHHVDVPAFSAEKGLGLEEAARILRYQIFSQLAMEKNAKLALAHHQEDNAETILFQMVRGSSLSGLCGMQPVRMDEKEVCYIRPLLGVRRAEIEQFLQERGQDYCIDSTNIELEYSRNFLRGQVLPALEQINERAVEHMNQTASHLSEVREYLDVETEKVWSRVATVEEQIILDAKLLMELHVVMQRQIAYKAIVCMANQKKDITSTHVEALLALCKGQSGKRITLPYGITAWKEFDRVHIAVCAAECVECQQVYEVGKELLEDCLTLGKAFSFSIGAGKETLSFRAFAAGDESLEIPRKTYTKWFDYDKIKKGFCIRTRRSGDYFISDALGHHKKLKQYFIDEKIPMAEREKKWLLVQDAQILWLVGGRISEHIKVTQETKYILEITYDGGC